MRPLTKKMKEVLIESRERELRHQPPQSIYYTQSAKGLITRGLIYAKEYHDCQKPYMGFYITELGIRYLDKMQTANKILQ